MKLGEQRQVTIPLDLIERLGWGEDTEVELVASEAGVIVRESADSSRDERTGKTFGEMTSDERTESFRAWLKKYAGTATGGMTTDEVMQLTRGDD